jgi:Pretoxin HINT domain
VETAQRHRDIPASTLGNLVSVTVAGEVIKSTGHHPWWVIRGEGLSGRPKPDHVPGNPDGYGGSGRWVDAIDLRVGDVLLLRSGEHAAISSLVVHYTRLTVYNFHVEELNCYAVGIAQILVHNNSVAEQLNALPEDQLNPLLARIARGDHKGRPFGSQAVPRMPTVEEFNPRILEIRAGDLAQSVKGRKHGIFPDQAERVSKFSNDDLIRFRLDDPMSATGSQGNLSLTGGHHRTAEIIKRVDANEILPDTIVKVLLHD